MLSRNISAGYAHILQERSIFSFPLPFEKDRLGFRVNCSALVYHEVFNLVIKRDGSASTPSIGGGSANHTIPKALSVAPDIV